jgi:hypothetical protein
MVKCINEITLRGPSELLDEFQKNKLLFSTYLPCPAGHSTEWCMEHWGTPIENKMNPDVDAYGIMDHVVNEVEYMRDLNTLKVRMNTSLSPPNAFLKHLIERFPGLWIKNLWSIGQKEGVWVAYMEDTITIKSLEW